MRQLLHLVHRGGLLPKFSLCSCTKNSPNGPQQPALAVAAPRAKKRAEKGQELKNCQESRKPDSMKRENGERLDFSWAPPQCDWRWYTLSLSEVAF